MKESSETFKIPDLLKLRKSSSPFVSFHLYFITNSKYPFIIIFQVSILVQSFHYTVVQVRYDSNSELETAQGASTHNLHHLHDEVSILRYIFY